MKVSSFYTILMVACGRGDPKNTAYREQHILGTTAFGGGGVTVWGCFSFDCKIDLYVLNGTMTGQKYCDIIRDIVVPHFDNHCLAIRPLFMDDNARPHRARIVSDYLRQESIDSIPWPAMSPDMNPIEHLWDDIGRKINNRVPACQNLKELRDALVQEWQSIPLRTLRHLVQSMRRRVDKLFRKRGGYTCY
jgi:transposase